MGCSGEGCQGECRQDQEEDDDEEDEFEDEEEYYNEGDDMQYQDDQHLDENINEGNVGGGGALGVDEDEEDDEEEYENEYAEDQEDEEAEIETLENSYIQQPSKYDYGTDNEDGTTEGGDETEISNSQQEGGQEIMRVKVLQTEISQEDFNNFLHKCTLNLPPQLSQKFVRLSKEFNNNIDYIMNYVYKLVGNCPL